MDTPLFIKTDNSLLSSLIKIDDLIEYALKNNIKCLTITDDNMYGVIEFYIKCKKNSIKPIIGLNKFGVVLYAKNYNGYKNLIKLNSLDELIYYDDLICITPIEKYEQYKDLFKDIFISYTSLDERNLIKKNNLVYCNEILCLEEKDYKYLKYLYLIKGCEFNKKDNYINNNKIYNIDSNNNKYITDNCNVEILLHQNLMPIYNKEDSYLYLKNLVKEGFKKKFGSKVYEVYLKRAKYELDIINKMGFCNYFLIVWDYVKYAKENDILVGPGRGSAAGSLIAYLLDITTIDPIKYDLLFERFLNPERISMPDIDIDFEYTKRDEVLNYCINKYGIKKVAPIITFGTLGSKQVIRDVGRVLNIDSKIVDNLSKKINPRLSLKENYNFVSKYVNDNDLKELYKISLKLEGLKRHTSIHAAGVVMSEYDLDEIIPIEKHDNFYTTGYSMEYLEDIGLLKMDFLALRNLTLINDCLKEINIKFDDIPNDDLKAISIFTDVNVVGIFQFESAGMVKFLKKFKPSSFDDITACIALYRPGPMQFIDEYIKRKNGLVKIDYIDKSLESILKPTYGIIVYQEQIMLIASSLAHYSLAEADLLRKAMSKKKEDILIKEKEKFINRCDNKETGTKVYEMILKFASYGFNKAHSVSYAMIAYRMAYIKVHYPNIFMKNLLTMTIGSEIKTKEYILECKRNNIKVVKPLINISAYEYLIINNNIIFPLTNIKGIGYNIASKIVEERTKESFKDIYDFITRCDIGIKTFEILIKAGCFDMFDINQKTLDNNIDLIYNYSSLGILDESLKPILTIYPEYSTQELLEREISVLGLYLSNHPVMKYRDKYNCIYLNEVDKYYNKIVDCLIYVEKVKKINTKNNKEMMFITGNDEQGKLEFVMFSDEKVLEHNICYVKGRVERRFDSIQIVVKEMEVLE